jgi:type I thyroxine 5'-deiodinase
MPSNLKDHVLVATAKTFGARDEAANSCVRKLGIEIPALVDDMRDTAERAYTGWPDRLYIVDHDGRIAYKSKAGPFGFHPDEMAQALAKTCGTVQPGTTEQSRQTQVAKGS